VKKIPMRKCLATGELCPKANLLRVVKDPSGKVFFDHSTRANGHGAYIKASLEAIDIAQKKKVLDRALETSVPDEVYDELRKEVNAR
jgi:predicted RNA-binding protein YlxR (DUF448 family)